MKLAMVAVNRLLPALSLLLISSTLVAPRVADIKVTVRTSYATSEVSGVEAVLMGVGASRITTIVLKGERLAATEPDFGARIVDFTQQKIYTLNPAQQLYTETPFAEARRKVANEYVVYERPLSGELDEIPSMAISLPTQSRSRAKRFEFRVEVTESGAHKRVVDLDTREVIVTVTAWERGKTLEESGGWMAASNVWLAPRLAAVDGLVAAQRRYAAAIAAGTFDPVFTVVEMRMSSLFHSRFPEEAAVAAKVVAEVGKLDGTVLSSVTNYGIVWNVRDMKLLTSRRGGTPPASTLTVTKMTLDYLSIDAFATDADVSIPAGFKLKK